MRAATRRAEGRRGVAEVGVGVLIEELGEEVSVADIGRYVLLEAVVSGVADVGAG